MDIGGILAQGNPIREIFSAMKPIGTMPEIAAGECLPAAALERRFALNAAVVYQDIPSRERVAQLCSRVARSIGRQSFHLRSWSFAELDQPEIFQGAVSAAVDADVMIVSLHAAEKLPAGFCAWIDAWLSRRQRPDGSLIALIGVSGRNGASSEYAQKYLRGVAWEARLEFLLRECAMPAVEGLLVT